MSASATIILDTRRMETKIGKFPVKLQVTYKSEPKRYQTIFDLSQRDFDHLKASRVSQEMKPIKESLKQIQRNVENVINAMQPFSFQKFEKEFILGHSDFKQRKNFQLKGVPLKLQHDVQTYRNKFPIFKKPVPEPGTILTVFLFISIGFCASIGLPPLRITKRRLIHLNDLVAIYCLQM